MQRLTPEQLRARLRLDERTMAELGADPAPISATGHASATAARRGEQPVAPGAGAPAEHYRVVFDFATLRGPGEPLRPVVVHIDLLGNGNYPFSEPICRHVGAVVPWVPHFHAYYPVCIGDGWPSGRDAGSALCVDLVTHLAHLLNFDEPAPRPGFDAFNTDAVAWWRQRGHRPLDEHLRYPRIDPNAISPTSPRHRFVPAAARFTAVGRRA